MLNSLFSVLVSVKEQLSLTLWNLHLLQVFLSHCHTSRALMTQFGSFVVCCKDRCDVFGCNLELMIDGLI